MQDYLDFELRLRQLEDGKRYSVEIKSAPIDTNVCEECELPAEEGFTAQLQAYTTARGEVATRKLGAPDVESAPAPLDIETLGAKLYQMLMPGDIKEKYKLSMQEAHQRGHGLRIVVRIGKDSPALAIYPWECARDESYLSLDTRTPIVRHVEVEAARPTVQVDLPLRILGMVGYRKNLDVEQEQRRLQNIIDNITPGGRVQIEWRPGNRYALLDALSDTSQRWHVFHFIGHGGFEDKARILLLDEKTGEPDEMPADELATMLANHETLQLAVLNSCEGGRVSPERLDSSMGAALGLHKVPAIISMQNPITDTAAIDFSRVLYSQLLEKGKSIEEAVTLARVFIQGTKEWSTPVVHIRSTGGRLLDLVESELVTRKAPAEAVAASGAATTPRASTAESSGAATTPAAAESKPRGGPQSPGGVAPDRLRKLAGKVRDAMEERREFIALDMESVDDAVEDEWSDGSIDVKAGQSIYDTFVKQGESLLVLGDPGVGKSTTVNELQHRLMEDFESPTQVSRRVPVRFSLKAWSDEQPMVDWMALTMARLTNVPEKVCKQFIEAGDILPLFEDFDQVDADTRVACVQAINAYKESVADGLLVASDNREYRQLPAGARLALNAAVSLKPFTREQVLKKVEELGEKYAGLLEVLRRDPNLLSDARSHRDLIQMITAYEGKSAEEIGISAGMTTKERKAARVGASTDRRIEQGLAALDRGTS